MKKLFTLLAAMLCAVASAWADADVIYSMTAVTGPTENLAPSTKADVTATFVGGSAEVYNGRNSATALVSSKDINLGGSSNSYFHAILTSGSIAEGDIITLSATGTLKISPTSSGATSVTFPYIVPSGSPLIGKTDVYLFKDGVSRFSSFTITRPDADDVAIPTITLSGSSVTITCSTTDASIYYTTDGTEPTTGSNSYTAAFTLENPCTVRAKAFKGENESDIAGNDCYVSHASAIAVLGYNKGTLNGAENEWTSTDGQYILTDNSEGRTIGYTNLAGSKDGFKINHTDNYTLQIPADLKVTKIVVVGKTWLTGSAGNAATISFDGFTPAPGTFFDYVSESYVKTIEFTPETERDYGAAIDINPGGNQLGAYIEIYGELRQGPADPITGKSVTEVVTFTSDSKVSSSITPDDLTSVITISGGSYKDKSIDGYDKAWQLSSGASIKVSLPSGSTNATLTILGTSNSTTLKFNGGSAQSVTWTGDATNGYKTTINIDDSYAGTDFTIAKGSGNTNIHKLTLTYTIRVAGEIALTTTANMAGWRAFYDADQGYTVDENTTVYVASAKGEDAITLTAIEGGIPAGTPVILKTSSSADSYKMTLTSASLDAYTGTNLLQVTTANQSLGDGTYRLGFGANGVGFYPYTTSHASAGIIYINTGSASRSLHLVVDGQTTGISDMTLPPGEHTEAPASGIFNLQGQRVSQPQHGLYIVNGRKLIVK